MINIEPGKIEIVQARQPTDGRFDRGFASLAAIDHPFQDAHIVAEAGPEKFSVRALAKPVHVKDEWWISQPLSDLEPMAKIIAHVVAAKGQHRNGITSHLPDRAGRGSGCF